MTALYQPDHSKGNQTAFSVSAAYIVVCNAAKYSVSSSLKLIYHDGADRQLCAALLHETLVLPAAIALRCCTEAVLTVCLKRIRSHCRISLYTQ